LERRFGRHSELVGSVGVVPRETEPSSEWDGWRVESAELAWIRS